MSRRSSPKFTRSFVGRPMTVLQLCFDAIETTGISVTLLPNRVEMILTLQRLIHLLLSWNHPALANVILTPKGFSRNDAAWRYDVGGSEEIYCQRAVCRRVVSKGCWGESASTRRTFSVGKDSTRGAVSHRKICFCLPSLCPCEYVTLRLFCRHSRVLSALSG